MKKRLLTAAFFVGAWGAYSQVGIGTLTPNNASQLDVVAKDKGILIPRIALKSTTDVTTVANANNNGYENSLLVFNTNTQNDITPGYYYWYVDKWMRIVNEHDVISLDRNTTNTSFTLVNGDLILTDSDGNSVQIPLAQINIITTLVKNTDGTYTYTSEDNTVTIIDIPASVVENFETIVNSGPVEINGDTFTTIEDYITHIANNVSNVEGSDFITVTGDGSTTNPYEITIKEGDVNSMLITNATGELEWATIESIVKDNETVTRIEEADGIYTYYNEEDTPYIIDIPASVVE